jgi:hypothetical protein
MANQGSLSRNCRVSTGRQGKSGLGLEVQRAALASYRNGADWHIVAEFTEVESGKRSDRPELDKALAAARLHGGSLDVSKVDRLTRSVSVLSRCSMLALTCGSPIFRRSKAQPAGSCSSKWLRLPSLKLA